MKRLRSRTGSNLPAVEFISTADRDAEKEPRPVSWPAPSHHTTPAPDCCVQPKALIDIRLRAMVGITPEKCPGVPLCGSKPLINPW
jgi:hypothetical protein